MINFLSLNSSISFVNRVFDLRCSTVPMINMQIGKPSFIPQPCFAPLECATPESQGVPSSLLADFLRDLKNDDQLSMHLLTFCKNGKIICRVSFGEQNILLPKYTFSAAKSVVSLAIGMLIDDGILSLDEKLVEIFQDETDLISRIKLKDVTIKSLLTMTSCVAFAELSSMTQTNWVKAFLSSSVKGDVNKSFNYNSLNTYMLSAIV
ncbi:MAG: serine hydrolase, partial [Clostridia bacterium]